MNEEMQDQQEGGEQPQEMRHQKPAEGEKVILNKDEVICPLVLKVTNGQSAVNYDLSPLTESVLPGQDKPGGWRSAPQNRGHSEAFYAELNAMKERGEIPEKQNAFYFTHEQGIAARQKYEQLVLDGKVKANKRSWGPNEDQADDKSRFHKSTGVTFKELTEQFPELYKSSTGSTSRERQIVEEEQPAAPELDLEAIEPSDEEIQTMDPETMTAGEREEEPVAATTATEAGTSTEELGEEGENLQTIYVPAASKHAAEEIGNDVITFKENNEDIYMFLVELPHNEMTYGLQEGVHVIEGYTYKIVREDDVTIEGSAEEEAGA